MDIKTKQVLIEMLGEYVTVEKKQKISEILAWRTRHITVALEDIFQPHNASAIIRSTECFGVQDVHSVQQKYQFNVNQGVARGSAYWINMHSYPSMQDCFKELKTQGYRVVATTPHEDAPYLHELPLDQKTALIFGTELSGISDYTFEHADGFVKIPMFGFTESYNVSVSVALCLYDLVMRLHASDIDWHLSEVEQVEVTLQWYRRVVRASAELEKLFFEQQKRPAS